MLNNDFLYFVMIFVYLCNDCQVIYLVIFRENIGKILTHPDHHAINLIHR